jgi:uncharacterized protein (TIGR00299 family) protein
MIAYLDCIAGISGDMLLGAMIDLGVPAERIVEEIQKLPLEGFGISASRVQINGIGATDVVVTATGDSHSRDYRQIRQLVEHSPLYDHVKQLALGVFSRLAEAEAGVHGCAVEDVHFHEVGGIDALVDIVGTAFCCDYLDLSDIRASSLPLGRGFVECRHGVLPLPAPATLALLGDVPVHGVAVNTELVTPTGAALITELASGFGEMPTMRIDRCGYGAGKNRLADRPNLLRVVLGNAEATGGEETLVQVETSIDDMNPEFYGHVMDLLFEDGAVDVNLVPMYMKKQRPATLLRVLCPESVRSAVVDRLLSETTSLGVRHHMIQRKTLPRESVVVKTALGPVAAKKTTGPDGRVRLAPEYEACRGIARRTGRPLQTVYQAALDACRGHRR